MYVKVASDGLSRLESLWLKSLSMSGVWFVNTDLHYYYYKNKTIFADFSEGFFLDNIQYCIYTDTVLPTFSRRSGYVTLSYGVSCVTSTQWWALLLLTLLIDDLGCFKSIYLAFWGIFFAK